ncbi:MAG: hypothetical protein ACI9BF_000500 [Candidatus Paceibacteria bacterium]|jgi:hypothetical protein
MLEDHTMNLCPDFFSQGENHWTKFIIYLMVCITAITYIISTIVYEQLDKRAIREVAHSFVLSLGKIVS